MNVRTKKSKTFWALSLITAQGALLSHSAAFADGLESRAQSTAASSTAGQIYDDVMSGRRDPETGKVIEQGKSSTEVSVLKLENSITEKLDRVTLKVSRVSASIGEKYQPLFGEYGPRTWKFKESFDFVHMYNEDAPAPVMYCIKQQFAEFKKVPGGIQKALAERNASLRVYFLNLYVHGNPIDVFSDRSYCGACEGKVRNEDAVAKIRRYGQNSESLYREYINKVESHAHPVFNFNSMYPVTASFHSIQENPTHIYPYLDIEGTCHIVLANELMAQLDKQFQARQTEKAEYLHQEEQLHDILDVAPAETSASEAK